jgi:hypothetical protein
MKHIALYFVLLIAALPVAAQSESATISPITYNVVVEESISDAGSFDWWQLQAAPGDQIAIRMTGDDGLAPLIGILDAGGTLLARSADGTPNGTVTLEFTIPEDGQYTIVATRVGLVDGTTTGRYTLRVERLNSSAPVVDPRYQEVVFRCRDFEVTTAVTLRLQADDGDSDSYRLTVYGIDGFRPAIRVVVSEQNTDFCIGTDDDAAGASITLPDEPAHVSAADDAAQVAINSGGVELGEIMLIIGGIGEATGRYIALLEGVAIEPAADTDEIGVRMGALPAERDSSLRVYMVSAGANNRLDPTLAWLDEDGRCDDAGRRGCEAIPPIVGMSVVFPEGNRIDGDRFDAGLILADGDPHRLEARSFNGGTSGAYALALIGELP